MTLYLYSNILGSFVFNEKGVKVEELRFKKDFLENFNKILEGEWLHEEGQLAEKNKPEEVRVLNFKKENFYDTLPVDTDDDKQLAVVEKMLSYFSKPEYFNEIKNRNTRITKLDMQASPITDVLVIQSLHNIEELEHSINTFSKRLREWYELHFPEASKQIQDHKKFAELVANKPKTDVMKELNIKESIGVAMSPKDLEPVYKLAHEIIALFELKQNQADYLENLLQDVCPNVKAVAGAMIAAKLISAAGSLKRLATFPSGTIQTLGAEKALFRHLKTGSKPPKYGFVLMHPLVAGSKNKGKAARILANKISVAVKVDYFKGEDFKGYELRQQLEKELRK